MTVKATAMVGVATLLIGIGVGWYVARLNANHEIRSIALAHELEMTVLCANGLTLERRPDSERLVVLLQHRLDSAVDYATQLVDEGARLYPGGSPNLRDAARRAAEHYAAVNNLVKKQEAETLLARLNEAQ